MAIGLLIKEPWRLSNILNEAKLNRRYNIPSNILINKKFIEPAVLVDPTAMPVSFVLTPELAAFVAKPETGPISTGAVDPLVIPDPKNAVAPAVAFPFEVAPVVALAVAPALSPTSVAPTTFVCPETAEIVK